MYRIRNKICNTCNKTNRCIKLYECSSCTANNVCDYILDPSSGDTNYECIKTFFCEDHIIMIVSACNMVYMCKYHFLCDINYMFVPVQQFTSVSGLHDFLKKLYLKIINLNKYECDLRLQLKFKPGGEYSKYLKNHFQTIQYNSNPEYSIFIDDDDTKHFNKNLFENWTNICDCDRNKACKVCILCYSALYDYDYEMGYSVTTIKYVLNKIYIFKQNILYKIKLLEKQIYPV